MIKNINRIFMFAFLALFLTACKSVTVENPTSDTVYTDAPEIRLTFPKGRPDPLEVTLNGSDITALLNVTEEGATASPEAIASLLTNGVNLLKIVKPSTPTVSFTFDNAGPSIHITEVIEGPTLSVSGYVEDASGITSVTANGNPLTLEEGNRFTAQVPDSSTIEFIAEDSLGYQSTQRYARPSETMTNAMAMRINSDGMGFIVEELENFIEGGDIGAIMRSFNPLQTITILTADYTIYVDDATINRAFLNMDIINSQGSLNTSGDLDNIWARFHVDVDGWILNYTINGELTLDHIGFAGNANVSASNGNVQVGVQNLTLDLDKIRTDIALFPDFLLTPFLELFEGLFENIFASQIEALIPEKLSAFLDAFPDSLVLDLNGNLIKPLILPQQIVSPNNGINIDLDAHISAVTSNGPNALGSAFVDSGTLPAVTTVTPSGDEKHVGVVLSENVINQALVAATESGVLNFEYTNTEIPQPGDIDPNGGDVRVRVVPTTAPIIDLISAQEEGLGRLIFHDFYLAFEIYNEGEANWTKYLGSTLDIDVRADLGITADNTIAIDVVGLPQIVIREIDNDSAIVFDEATAQTLFNEFLPVVLPVIMNAVGAIPLPSFKGYGFSVGDLWVMDNEGYFTAIAGDLVKVAVTATAPRPVTYAQIGNMIASRTLLGSPVIDDEVVTIDVSSDNPSDGDVHYRYSVDGAPYGLWKRRDNIKLYGLRTGSHDVSICSRTALLKENAECESVSFDVN